MSLIDTHCHIYAERFDADSSEVMQRARDVGVERILMPNIDSSSIESMLKLEEDYSGYCIPMMGLHPCSVGADLEKEMEIVREWFDRRDFIAVGELGLDLHWDQSTLQDQIKALEEQFEIAIEKGIPAVIHCREAFDELMPVLKRYQPKGLRAVLHCFTGTYEYARECIDMGFYLGIGGVVTFKNGGVKELVEQLGLKNIVLETDSPYLAPVPHRGKRNEPSYVNLVALKISDILELTLEEVIVQTGKNAESLFNLSSWK